MFHTAMRMPASCFKLDCEDQGDKSDITVVINVTYEMAFQTR
jgi:hypothetical protein